MKNIFAGVRAKSLSNQKGFTLVEMLVVVAIIAILASVFLVGLSGFRQSAYDARRLSDIQNVQTYLERYYNAHQSYPNVTVWSSKSGGDLPQTLNGVLQADGILSNNQNLPVDPAGGSLANPLYEYCSLSNNQSYVIGVPLSNSASAWKQGLASTPAGCNFSVPCSNQFTTSTPSVYCVQF